LVVYIFITVYPEMCSDTWWIKQELIANYAVGNTHPRRNFKERNCSFLVVSRRCISCCGCGAMVEI